MSTPRPIALGPGALAFAGSWLASAAIARLTGASSIVIVLVVTAVMFAGAAAAGFVALRRIGIHALRVPSVTTIGDESAVEIDVDGVAWIAVSIGGDVVADGWTDGAHWRGNAHFRRRGVFDRATIRLRHGGWCGLVWWERRIVLPCTEVYVAPWPAGGGATEVRAHDDASGVVPGRLGAAAGDVDGIRQWRDGDGERAVHWPTSLRAGELVVHDRRDDDGALRIVRVDQAASEPEAELGRARGGIDDLLRHGERVRAVCGAEQTDIADHDTAARWAASCRMVREPPPGSSAPSRHAGIDEMTTPGGRWWTAGSVGVSLALLCTTLGLGAVGVAVVAGGLALGTAVSTRAIRAGTTVAARIRAAAAIASLAVVILIIAASGAGDAGVPLLELLRGPLPLLLAVLVVLHGFECTTLRSAQIALGVGGVVACYSAGLRVDDALVWWLVAWWVVTVIAVRRVGAPRRAACAACAAGGRSRPLAAPRRHARTIVTALATAAIALGVLAVVPIPQGPARLTMPTFIGNAARVTDRAGVADPDGRSISDDPPSDRRLPGTQVGGYPGFSRTLDTALRGDMGDDVVLRVRANQPDYWRGQTFATFDGRTWYAAPQANTGRGREAIVEVGPSWSDPRDDTNSEEFVQTYYVETDLPNILFAAYQPAKVVVDAEVWPQDDGTLRSSVVLPKGSVYTVVSHRIPITAAMLRAQGDVAAKLSDAGRAAFAAYLAVPPSTTPATIELATDLAELSAANGPRTTYDVARSYEQWFRENIAYDLDVPVPPAGADAVDHFLFESRLGFCEQIASAFTIMLRTQGIPARLVTGYVSGTRDEVSGVWEVRASDAHAWVEVWFPETGWQAFDPTAGVPLAGEAGTSTIGADLVRSLADTVSTNGTVVLAGLGAAGALWVLSVAVRRERYRRRRGRWGVLQDRFLRAAERRGVVVEPPTNPAIAREWGDRHPDRSRVVDELAATLDRAAFDPTWRDDDVDYDAAREMLERLDA